MKLDLEDYVFEIAATVSAHLGDTLDCPSVSVIARPRGKEQIADATMAFTVNGKKTQDDIVLLVSNPAYPQAVADDLKKAKAVMACVDSNAGSRIIKPIVEGTHDTQTYAAFSRLGTMSDNRLVRYAQKRHVTPKVISWCASVAQQCKSAAPDKDEYESKFVQPLVWLSENPDSSDRLKSFSSDCLNSLRSSPRALWTTVEHGDFWIGNILFDYKASSTLKLWTDDFVVIDWGGSRLDGYPCTDVIRLLTSLYGRNATKPQQLFSDYKARLGLSDYEAALYAVMSMGQLGQNLEQFPKARFNTLCERVFDFVLPNGPIAPD